MASALPSYEELNEITRRNFSEEWLRNILKNEPSRGSAEYTTWHLLVQALREGAYNFEMFAGLRLSQSFVIVLVAPDGVAVIPAFQINEGKVRPLVAEINYMLRVANGSWAGYDWWVQPHAWLEAYTYPKTGTATPTPLSFLRCILADRGDTEAEQETLRALVSAG